MNQKKYFHPYVLMLYGEVALLAVFVLLFAGRGKVSGRFFSFALNGTAFSLPNAFLFSLLFFLCWEAARILWNIRIGRNGGNVTGIFSAIDGIAVKKFVRDFALYFLPAAGAVFLGAYAVGIISAARAGALRDELLVGADVLFAGSPLSFTISSVHYPRIFVLAVRYAYLLLGPSIFFFGVFLFVKHRKLFVESAAALIGSFVLMLTVWSVVPALTPQDRFIDNRYHLPISKEIQNQLTRYRPQKEIRDFQRMMRENEAPLKVLSVSTMPSAHIAWAVLLIYYAFRVSPFLALVLGPFALLSSFGTVLFAQHYAIDVPAGMLVGILTIAVTRWIGKSSARPLHP